jgi:hypothetical protein
VSKSLRASWQGLAPNHITGSTITVRYNEIKRSIELIDAFGITIIETTNYADGCSFSSRHAFRVNSVDAVCG